jgi:hypothetical protein
MTPMRPALIAGLIYAGSLLALGVVLGAFRTFVFEPWLGAWPALLIELPVILYAAWHVAGAAMEGRELTRTGAAVMGGVAIVLLLIGEAAMSQILSGRTLLAHCVHPDDEEIGILARSGAHVAHNPVSNLKLATGRVFDYPEARRRGVHVGLGTDGTASITIAASRFSSSHGAPKLVP